MKKKILAYISLTLIIAGGSGCAMLKKETAEEKLVSMMEEKYGEKFEFTEWSYQDIGSQSRTAHMECSSFPGEEIEAGQTENAEGELTYFDDYMGYQYKDEIQLELAETLQQAYPASKIFFQVDSTIFPAAMGPDMAVQDIICNKSTLLSAIIVIHQKWDPQSKDEQLEQWRAELERQNMRVNGVLFITEDKDAFEKINAGNQWQWTEKNGWYGGCCYFAMDKAYEFYYADWR